MLHLLPYATWSWKTYVAIIHFFEQRQIDFDPCVVRLFWHSLAKVCEVSSRSSVRVFLRWSIIRFQVGESWCELCRCSLHYCFVDSRSQLLYSILSIRNQTLLVLDLESWDFRRFSLLHLLVCFLPKVLRRTSNRQAPWLIVELSIKSARLGWSTTAETVLWVICSFIGVSGLDYEG